MQFPNQFTSMANNDTTLNKDKQYNILLWAIQAQRLNTSEFENNGAINNTQVLVT